GGGARRRRPRRSYAPQDERRVLGTRVAGHDPDLGVRHLARAGVAAQLTDGLDDVVHGEDEGLRELPAARVHGERAAELDASTFHERSALAARAEAHVLELLDHE